MIEERQENECGGRSAGNNADKCLSFSPLSVRKRRHQNGEVDLKILASKLA